MSENIKKEIDGWSDEVNFVLVSDFLLRKYVSVTKKPNGQTIVKGSPYEALVFGKVVRLQQGYYGYCSLSKEEMAWELGASYDSILRAFKNLIADGYIKEVQHAKEDHNRETKAYVAVRDKLVNDVREWKKNGITYFKDDPDRKSRYNKLKKEKPYRLEQQDLSLGATRLIAESDNTCSSEQQGFSLQATRVLAESDKGSCSEQRNYNNTNINQKNPEEKPKEKLREYKTISETSSEMEKKSTLEQNEQQVKIITELREKILKNLIDITDFNRKAKLKKELVDSGINTDFDNCEDINQLQNLLDAILEFRGLKEDKSKFTPTTNFQRTLAGLYDNSFLVHNIVQVREVEELCGADVEKTLNMAMTLNAGREDLFDNMRKIHLGEIEIPEDDSESLMPF